MLTIEAQQFIIEYWHMLQPREHHNQEYESASKIRNGLCLILAENIFLIISWKESLRI